MLAGRVGHWPGPAANVAPQRHHRSSSFVLGLRGVSHEGCGQPEPVDEAVAGEQSVDHRLADGAALQVVADPLELGFLKRA